MKISDYQARQGDVLLMRVDSLPEAMVATPQKGLHMLAYGEVTGHAHYVPALEAAMLEANDAIRVTAAEYGIQEARLIVGGLRVAVGATLWHGTPTLDPAGPRDADHTALTLPAGDYLVLTPMEYSDENEFVRIAD